MVSTEKNINHIMKKQINYRLIYIKNNLDRWNLTVVYLLCTHTRPLTPTLIALGKGKVTFPLRLIQMLDIYSDYM